MGQVIARLKSVDRRIDSIEAFGVRVDAERRFSFKIQKHRDHAFLAFNAGMATGWAEANLDYDPLGQAWDVRTKSMQCYQGLIGMTVGEALQSLVENREGRGFNHRDLECAEMALLDLAGRLLEVPTIELMGLKGHQAIPGVYCILSDDPDTVRLEAQRAIEQNLKTHVKCKLFGNLEKDLAVIRAVREIHPPETFLVGDVNMGYRRKPGDTPVTDVVDSLRKLHQAGLSACEDPAQMSKRQWEEVQRAVGKLGLVPDVPLRPSWKALEQITPGMGAIFNMHPGCMGSLLETACLGLTIRSWGKRLMVGDSSLVGPACTTWQQVAIGLEADWVEAIEKPQENDVIGTCRIDQATGRTADGRFEIKKRKPGFGLELDKGKLKEFSTGLITFR